MFNQTYVVKRFIKYSHPFVYLPSECLINCSNNAGVKQRNCRNWVDVSAFAKTTVREVLCCATLNQMNL